MTDSDRHFIGPFVRLHQADHVVVARTDVEAGTAVEGASYVVRDRVPAGHKMATVALRKGDPILKYNTVIGFAACDVQPGTMLHSHNIEFREFAREYEFSSEYRPVEKVPEAECASFRGFVRSDGRVGTRNFIVLVSSVNCSATVVHRIAEWFTPERLADFPNVDGVIPIATMLGCGMEASGEPMELLQRTLGGYIRHPNSAGAIAIGLGCERCQVEDLLQHQKMQTSPQLRTMVMQELGGTRKTIAAGIAAVQEMLPEANRATRKLVSAKYLSVGLQCGGSDGFSSITANPSLGTAMDVLVRHGERLSCRRHPKSTVWSTRSQGEPLPVRSEISSWSACAGGRNIPEGAMSRSTDASLQATMPAGLPISWKRLSALP